MEGLVTLDLMEKEVRELRELLTRTESDLQRLWKDISPLTMEKLGKDT